MAKVETKLWVTAYFDKEGKFCHYSLSQYKPLGKMDEYGMMVSIREIDFVYETPKDMNEVNILAAGALEAFITKERGEHQVRMMKLEAALNSMRGIGYTEVLNPERNPRNLTGHRDGVGFEEANFRVAKPRDVDDIPF